MRLLNPSIWRLIPCVIWAILLAAVVSCWIMMAFVHRDAQYRSLAPEYYKVRVVTADEYQRLTDPSNRDVMLSDGTNLHKAAVWDEAVLPNFKPTDDGKLYVLVTTKGTAHMLPYMVPQLIVFGFFATCGLVVSLWNLRLKSPIPNF